MTHLPHSSGFSKLPPEGSKGARGVKGAKGNRGAKGKKIVLIAGPKSHGYAGHEHRAGCLLLARRLEALPGVTCTVCEHGWPDDSEVLDGARAIVIFCNGGGGHVARPHMKELKKLILLL